jgi:hypothetical protein
MHEDEAELLDPADEHRAVGMFAQWSRRQLHR